MHNHNEHAGETAPDTQRLSRARRTRYYSHYLSRQFGFAWCAHKVAGAAVVLPERASAYACDNGSSWKSSQELPDTRQAFLELELCWLLGQTFLSIMV